MKTQLLTLTTSLFFLSGCIPEGGIEGAIAGAILGNSSQSSASRSNTYPNTAQIEIMKQQQQQAFIGMIQQKVARGEMTQAQAQQLLANFQRNPSASNTIDTSPLAQNSMTERELQQKMSEYPKVTVGVKFEKERDGFSINGDEVYIDPEGQIVSYGYDWKDGSFFYLIRTGNGYKVKFNRVNSQKPSLTIATMQNRGSISGTTVSGQKFTGEGIIPTSTGFIITRNNTAIIYTAGTGMKNFSAPKNWKITPLQRGDVASTKYILLEKDSKQGLFDDAFKIGKVFGFNKQEEYALINIETKKIVPLNISIKKNQALYSSNNNRNINHYYWNINWFKGKDTFFSVSKEQLHRKIFIRDLNTKKTVEAGSSYTGYTGFLVNQDSDGKVRLYINHGISFAGLGDTDIADAEEFLRKNKAI